MKLTYSLNQDQFWKTRTVIPGLCRTLTLLLCGAGSFQAQTPPPGTNGGNVTPCPCGCDIIPGSQVEVTTPCGEECAVVEALPPTTYTENFTEASKDCVSGQKNFSQEVTVTSVRRKTKLSGTLTYQARRVPPANDPNANCSGCPPCPPLVETVECGQLHRVCPPREGDQTETRGPKVDKGCVPTPV